MTCMPCESMGHSIAPRFAEIQFGVSWIDGALGTDASCRSTARSNSEAVGLGDDDLREKRSVGQEVSISHVARIKNLLRVAAPTSSVDQRQACACKSISIDRSTSRYLEPIIVKHGAIDESDLRESRHGIHVAWAVTIVRFRSRCQLFRLLGFLHRFDALADGESAKHGEQKVKDGFPKHRGAYSPRKPRVTFHYMGLRQRKKDLSPNSFPCASS